MPGVRKIVKRISLAIAIVLVIMSIAWWNLLTYGLEQGQGQLRIMWEAKPVEEFLASPVFPDSLKAKLRLIDHIRRFAIDSLGLKDTRNYKTLYDQQGEEIMWVVIASEPFRLKSKEWKFPIVGTVPYKGFFDKSKAIALKAELERDGWDVDVRNPGGWSTLGWFTDPILSKMLNRSDGDLASLIIHEMSHATIFVKDSVDFNENLATFIGDRGAEQFLISYYGADSEQYTTYIDEQRDDTIYSAHMLHGAAVLDSLYNSFEPHDSDERKLRLKNQLISDIVLSLDTLSLRAVRRKPSERFRDRLPNNAYFMNFIRYQSQQDVFVKEWQGRFHSNLREYIGYMREKYPFL